MLEDVTFRLALESLQLDGKCHIFGGTTGDDIVSALIFLQSRFRVSDV